MMRDDELRIGPSVGLIASGCSSSDMFAGYPYLEADDLREALTYAAWRVDEIELPLVPYEAGAILLRFLTTDS